MKKHQYLEICHIFTLQRQKVGKRLLPTLVLLLAGATAIDTVGAEIIEIKLGSKAYRIELAVTQAQRRQGLMYRSRLDSDAGMLLVYPQSGDHRVWMKDMLIPLRVYWIDAQFRVVGLKRLEPCVESPCAVYATPQASRYILELGDYDHALKPGDRIEGLRDVP